MSGKPEIWFYHLERSSLYQVLPTLLEKTLERGWRALIKSSHAHRLDELDERLWTFDERVFCRTAGRTSPMRIASRCF
jgi:DNA polymerase-3 subunit chi